MKTFFAGDVCPTPANAHLFFRGDIDALFTDVLPLMQTNDVTAINLECALTESENKIPKIGPNLKAPIQSAATLKAAGVSVCLLSNNHVFDYGKEGARDTLAALEKAALQHTGYGNNRREAQRPLVITNNEESLCIIAVCEHEYSYALEDREGACGFDPFETPQTVRAAKEKYRRVVVVYHGGKEMCQYPSPRLRSACHALAKSGADLILCQHSHCIGCYECFENCHILYGQGNYHFVGEKGEDPSPSIWDSGLAVRYDTESHEIEWIPIKQEREGITLVKGKEKEELLQEFHQRNARLQDGSWYEGWLEFCESNRELYTKILVRPGAIGEPKHFEHFAHYMDCEAHRDVWMELFKTHNHRNER